MTNQEIMERLIRIEAAVENLKDDIEELKQRLNIVNGIREDVGEMKADVGNIYTKQQFFVRRDEFAEIRVTLQKIEQKICDHIEEHRRVWTKMGVLAAIVSAIVSGVASLVSWIRGNMG